MTSKQAILQAKRPDVARVNIYMPEELKHRAAWLAWKHRAKFSHLVNYLLYMAATGQIELPARVPARPPALPEKAEGEG